MHCAPPATPTPSCLGASAPPALSQSTIAHKEQKRVHTSPTAMGRMPPLLFCRATKRLASHLGHGRHLTTDDFVHDIDGAVTAGPAAPKSCLQVLKCEAAWPSCRTTGKPFHCLLDYPVSMKKRWRVVSRVQLEEDRCGGGGLRASGESLD